jgi:hypothetical protein
MGSHPHLNAAVIRKALRRSFDNAVLGCAASLALLAGTGPALAQAPEAPATVRMVAQDVAPGTWFVQGLSRHWVRPPTRTSSPTPRS